MIFATHSRKKILHINICGYFITMKLWQITSRYYLSEIGLTVRGSAPV
jgi:hypothetical protein